MSWDEVAPGIHRISTPAPTRGQPRVNIYVLSGKDGVVVYDPGYGSRRCSAIALRGVAKLLVHLKREGVIDPRVPLHDAVKLVIISHEHHDHASGAVAFKRCFPSCRVAASRATAALLDRRRARAGSRRAGWNRALAVTSRLASRVVLRLLGMPGTIHVDAILADGDELVLGDRHLDVMIAPGHAPGQLLLHDQAAGWLLSSDLVLASVSTWLGPPRSDYTAYQRSMARIGASRATMLLPAHGRIINDVPGRLRELLRFRLLRERQVARACIVPRSCKTVAWMLYKDRGPATVFIATGMVRLVMEKLARDGILSATRRRFKGACYVLTRQERASSP